MEEKTGWTNIRKKTIHMGFHMLCVHIHTRCNFLPTRKYSLLTDLIPWKPFSKEHFHTEIHTHSNIFIAQQKKKKSEGISIQYLCDCEAVCCGRGQITIRAVGIHALSLLGSARSQEQYMKQPWVRACRGTNTAASDTLCLTTGLARS